MTEPVKDAVLAAMRRIAGPLARLLVEAGVGTGEFNAIMKSAFVQAARESGESGQANASRIATLTGLTRREVAELLKPRADQAPEPERGRPRVQRVLTGWWTDPDFQDALGNPAPLTLRKGKVSFAALVRRYSGEPRVVTIMNELLRVKAVRKAPDGRYEALSRGFAPARWEPEGMTVIGEQIRDHLETLIHNLKRPSRPRYSRIIENSQLDPKHAPLLTRDIAAQADSLADSLDDALNNPNATVRPGHEVKDAVRLGVAFYVFETPVTVERPAVKRPSRSSARRKRT